jgi:hypothetical protein
MRALYTKRIRQIDEQITDLKNEKKRYCEDLKNEIDPAIRRILNCEDNQFISFSLTDNREDTRIELVIYTSKGTPCAVVYGYYDGRFAVQQWDKALDFLLPEASEIKKNWTDITKLLEE